MARALGWFSIGLGLAELTAPRGIARMAGIQYPPGLLRLMGTREIATGFAILAAPKSAAAMGGRVAGDAIDLALLGSAFGTANGGERPRLAAATVAAAGITALDMYCARQLAALPENRIVHIRRSITIHRDPETLYNFWRDYSNLPRIMTHLESVRVGSDNRSHWVARGPGGLRVEWDSEEVEDRPGSMIAWRSLPGSAIEAAGSVRFARTTRGDETIVHHEMRYSTAGGVFGASVARLFGRAPEQELTGALRRFKQLMETGEIATVRGQPAARRHEPVYERIGESLRTN